MKYVIRFLAVMAAFLAIEQTSFLVTRQMARNVRAEKEQRESLLRLPPKSESTVRVNAQMNIFLEEYSIDTGQLILTEPYWDVSFAGMDEEELRLFLTDASRLEEEGDEKRGYVGCELIEMDWSTLRIRKMYKIQYKERETL